MEGSIGGESEGKVTRERNNNAWLGVVLDWKKKERRKRWFKSSSWLKVNGVNFFVRGSGFCIIKL